MNGENRTSSWAKKRRGEEGNTKGKKKKRKVWGNDGKSTSAGRGPKDQIREKGEREKKKARGKKKCFSYNEGNREKMETGEKKGKGGEKEGGAKKKGRGGKKKERESVARRNASKTKKKFSCSDVGKGEEKINQ